MADLPPSRYLTWDSGKFPHPEVMLEKLSHKGRKVREQICLLHPFSSQCLPYRW